MLTTCNSFLFIDGWAQDYSYCNALTQSYAKPSIYDDKVSFKGNAPQNIKEKLYHKHELRVICINTFLTATWPKVVYCIFISFFYFLFILQIYIFVFAFKPNSHITKITWRQSHHMTSLIWFNISSRNGLSPKMCQAISFTYANIFTIPPKETNYAEIRIKTLSFFQQNTFVWWTLRCGRNVLIRMQWQLNIIYAQGRAESTTSKWKWPYIYIYIYIYSSSIS